MGWRGVVLFFLSLLLAVSLALTIIGLQGFTLLSADTYLPALEKNDFYTQLAGSFGENDNFFIRNNESLRLLFENALTSAFDYINGRTDTLNLTIDLQSQDLRKIIVDEIGRLPVCDEMEQDQLCRPQNLSAEEAYDLALREGRIPAAQTSVDLGPYINQNGSLNTVRERVDTYKTAVYSVVSLSIVLIVLILLIGWKTQSRGLRNVGVPIFLSGIGILIGAYLGFSIAFQAISSAELLEGNFSPIAILNDILDVLKTRLFISAFILILVGIVLFVSSFIFKRKEEEK